MQNENKKKLYIGSFIIETEEYGYLDCFMGLSGGNHFYKIKIPNFKSKGRSEVVYNHGDNFTTIGGVRQFVLRIGEGLNGEQKFIETNRDISSEKNLSEQKSNGESIGKYFIEDYIPVESFEFELKCNNVFKSILNFRKRHKEIPSLVDFKRLVEAIF